MGACGSRLDPRSELGDVVIAKRDEGAAAEDGEDIERKPSRSFEKILAGGLKHIKDRFNESLHKDAESLPHEKEQRKSFEKLQGMKTIKEQYQESLQMDAEKLAHTNEQRKSFEKLHGTGLKDVGGAEFSKNMEQDNAKRGAASQLTARSNDLLLLVGRVAKSDPSLAVLDLSDHQPFLWLSAVQRLSLLEKIAGGSRLRELTLNSLTLSLVDIQPIAAAVRSHTRLERLSLERNSLNEAALVVLSQAIAGHPSLKLLQVAEQCNQELLTQRALHALLDAMEITPPLTTLAVGKVIDPSLRRRLDAVTMANRDLHRQHRVATHQHDTRKAAEKAFDWAAEARAIAESRPFNCCKPADATSEAAKQLSYVATGSPLWSSAKEEERIAVLEAFCSNTKVTSLVLANTLLADALVADKFEKLLASNGTLTSLNLESNRIASAGFSALAAGLLRNTTLCELKLANQHLAISQAAEVALADAVFKHPRLRKLTVELRNLRARELIQKAQLPQRPATPAPRMGMPPGAFGTSFFAASGCRDNATPTSSRQAFTM